MPYLSHPDPGFAEICARLAAPALERFAAEAHARWLVAGDAGPAGHGGGVERAAPHERALRQLWNWPPRPRCLCAPGTPAGASRLRLMHWQLGREGRVGMLPDLPIDADEDQRLRADLAALFDEPQRAVRIEPGPRPGEWLLHDAELAALDTASPEQAALWGVERLRPCGAAARGWQRRCAEIEMLLYTHPVNEARSRHGQPPVNAVWLWGGNDGQAAAAASPQQLDWRHDHVAPLLAGDWDAFAQALRALDAALAPMLAQPEARLLLAGARGALLLERRARRWWQAWRRPVPAAFGTLLAKL